MERKIYFYRDALIGRYISHTDFQHGTISQFVISDIRFELTDGVSYIRMSSKDAQFELLVLIEVVDSLIEKGRMCITSRIGDEIVIQDWHLTDSLQHNEKH